MKRVTKRLLAIALVFVLSFSLLSSVEFASAKTKKPSIAKKLSLNVSQLKTLKVKNIAKSKIKKTTWTVGNKKMLKISKKSKTSVQLKGLRAGTTKVKAVVKVGKKNYKLITTVKISKKKQVTPITPTVEPVPTVEPTTPIATKQPIETPTPTIAPLQYTHMEDLPLPNKLTKIVKAPELLTMWDGTKVDTKEQWESRRQEIKGILQRYMYGIWRDGSEEEVSYKVSGNTLTITVTRGESEASFKATFNKPSGTAPAEGWPVIVGIGGVNNSYIAQKGYSTISFTPTDVATDNTARKGAFYTLYPYKVADWKQQTGSVMAWAWGASKIIDALENGAGAELGISAKYTIVTGVSRYGKAAAAAGAFEERFMVSMPVCSGYGGMTMGRYGSDGFTYNLLPDFVDDPKKDAVGDLSAWKSTGGNESIGSLQGAGWFNETYKSFESYQHVPFDAHFLASLSAMENRYLFIVTGINSDMWSSPPGFWWCYKEAKPAFDLIGLSDNLAIQMHLNLHGIETVDLCKLFAFTDYHFYNKATDTTTFPTPWDTILKDFTLDSLKTCVFASKANEEAYEAGMPIDPDTLPPNPDVKAGVSVMFGNEAVEQLFSRSKGSDALISLLTGDQEGTGFNFKYGPKKHYGESYARFNLVLPEGKKLSDYQSVTFTCQTKTNYAGKRMALVVNPISIGLPELIDYDYGSGRVTSAINLSGGMNFPENTSKAQTITMPIDEDLASDLDGEDLECSIYIHMEHGSAKAEYTITNIKFNP